MRLAYMMATPEVRTWAQGWTGETAAVGAGIAAIGYTGVEVQTRDPAAFDRRAFARTLRDAGLTVAMIGTGPMGSEDRLAFVHPDAEVRRRATERYAAILAFAAELGADVSVGSARGRFASVGDRETAWGYLHAALETLLPVAERHGVRLVIEPQNRFQSDALNTVAETLDLIARYRSPALALEADLYHMVLEEASIPAALVTAHRSGLLAHVQAADTNRGAPGRGWLPWRDAIGTLHALGYDRFVCVECAQGPDSGITAREAYAFLAPLVARPTGSERGTP